MERTIEDKLASPLFDALLTKLRGEQISHIEYGPNDQPYSFLNFLRIRWISTPAGMQYAIKLLHQGIEGSGIYFQSGEELRMKLHLAICITRYEQPSPMIQRMREKLNHSYTPVPLNFYEGK